MNERIHLQISLVGGQPTPVYQGIVHLHPDKVMLVCSKETEKVAKTIKSQLPFYAAEDVTIRLISDNDFDTMSNEIADIESELVEDITLSLNLSSGLKIWTVLFYDVFRSKRSRCQTFCVGQDGTFFDLKNSTSDEKVAFDMDAQFKILGHQLDEYTPLTDYTSEDFDVLNRVQSLGFGERTHYHLYKITEQFYAEYKEEFGNVLLKYDFEVSFKYNRLSWHADTHTFECKLGYNEYTFCSPHVEHIVLNTGWFELYVARLIAKKYGEDKVRLNCIFRNVKRLPKNEIDIIVNTGSKLIFVECKTQIYNTTDVDKFRSAVRNYGGLGSKPLFVTYSQMKAEGLEKCNDHRIDTFYLDNPAYGNQKDKVDALSSLLDKLNKNWNV